MGRKRFNLIYKATNTIDGKCYVGQTIFTLAARKASHKRKALKMNKKSPFYDAIREQGFGVFKWEIVCYCKDQEELDIKEQETIEQIGKENCYNAYSGGKTHFKIPEQTREVLAEQKKGKNNPRYGKKLSQEEKTRLLKSSMEVCCKSVCKIDSSGNIIATYESISECARQNNVSVGTVSLHANGKTKTQKYRFYNKR